MRRDDGVAQRVDRAADEPRDVHLRDPDLVGDLALGQPLEEAQAQDLALARGQLVEAAAQHQALLGSLEALVGLADRLERADPVGQRLVERHHAIGLAGAERLDHLVDGRLRAGGELLDGGRAPEVAGERLARTGEPGVELLHVARHPQHPPAIAEVALDLAGDRRYREGRELDLAVEIEAIDGLQQPDRRDLLEVVERLALVRVAPRQAARQRKHPGDELLARLVVLLVVPPAQERTGFARWIHVPLPGTVSACQSCLPEGMLAFLDELTRWTRPVTSRHGTIA